MKNSVKSKLMIVKNYAEFFCELLLEQAVKKIFSHLLKGYTQICTKMN